MSHLTVTITAIFLSLGSLSHHTLSDGSLPVPKPPNKTERQLYFSPDGDVNVQLVIATSSRPSHQIISNILLELLTTKLHYSNVVLKYEDTGKFDDVVQSFSQKDEIVPEAMVNLEVWQPTGFDIDDVSEIADIDDVGPLGPVVSPGIFLPEDVVQKFWKTRMLVIDHWRSFKHKGESSMFHSALPGKSYNTIRCSRNDDCASILFLKNEESFLSPVVDYINSTGVLMYPLVISNTTALERLLSTNSQPPLLFSVSPNSITLRYKLVKIDTFCDILHYSYKWCKQLHEKKLHKWVWKKVLRYAPYAYTVIKNIYFSQSDYENLLRKAIYLDKSIGSEKLKEHYNQIAKNWIKNNTHVWKKWLPEVPPKAVLEIACIFPTNGSRALKNILPLANGLMELVNEKYLKNHTFSLSLVSYNVSSDNVGSVLYAYNQIVLNCSSRRFVGIIAATWPDISIPLVELSSKYDMPVISPTVATLNKRDQNGRYTNFFRIIHDHTDYAQVIVKFAMFFKWHRIAILHHNGLLFTQQTLAPLEVTADFQVEESKLTMEIVKEALLSAEKKRSRIFLVDFHQQGTSLILCAAAKFNMTASRGYVWILGAWVVGHSNQNSTRKIMRSLGCSESEINSALDTFFSMTAISNKALAFIHNYNIIAMLKTRFNITNESDRFYLYRYLFDTFATYAQAISKLMGPGTGGVDRFIDNATKMQEYIEYISNISFYGVTGPVRFSNDNVRTPENWTLYQYVRTENHGILIDVYNIRINDEYPMKSIEMKLHKFPGNVLPRDGSVLDCEWPLFSTYFDDCGMSRSISIALIVGSAVIGFIIVTVLIFVTMRWYIKKMNARYPQPFAELQEALSDYEIPRSALLLQYPLGEGAFGTVYYGEMKTDGNWTGIAAKVLREGATSQERREFLCEALKMCNFEHSNVMTIIGVVTSEPHYVNVMEFMLLGDLRKYLLTRHHVAKTEPDAQDIRPQTLTGMALDIARGLEYLQQNKLVHRDLACRNCLVDKEYRVKIGDFGMTREVDDRKAYYRFEHPGILPVRWMAPESIQSGLFNFCTDIWSYGVVLYEIVTFGNQPYRGRTNEEVIDSVKRYTDSLANYLVKPEERIPELFELMRMCWSMRPEERPLISYLIRRLEVNPECVRPCLDESPPDPGEARPRGQGIDRCASMFGGGDLPTVRGNRSFGGTNTGAGVSATGFARMISVGSRSSCDRTRFASGNRVDTDLRHSDSAGRVNNLTTNSFTNSIASRLGFLRDTPSSKWYSGGGNGSKSYRHTCSQEFLSYSRHHSGDQEISTVSDPHAYQVEYDPLMFVTVQSIASNTVTHSGYSGLPNNASREVERGSSSGGQRDDDDFDADQQTLLKAARA